MNTLCVHPLCPCLRPLRFTEQMNEYTNKINEYTNNVYSYFPDMPSFLVIGWSSTVSCCHRVKTTCNTHVLHDTFDGNFAQSEENSGQPQSHFLVKMAQAKQLLHTTLPSLQFEHHDKSRIRISGMIREPDCQNNF